jgi:hypothetical protein
LYEVADAVAISKENAADDEQPSDCVNVQLSRELHEALLNEMASAQCSGGKET